MFTADARVGAGQGRVPGVTGENLALAALGAFRGRVGGALPPIDLRIQKRIPVAAGLGGGSADAAAALRIANAVAGEPLSPGELRELAGGLGSDVPSQVEPRHAIVQGTGELIEPPGAPGTDGGARSRSRRALDRRRICRARPSRWLARGARSGAAAARRWIGRESGRRARQRSRGGRGLRPQLADTLERIQATGALGAAVSSSGPTCFGLDEDRQAAAERRPPFPGDGHPAAAGVSAPSPIHRGANAWPASGLPPAAPRTRPQSRPGARPTAPTVVGS